MGIRFGWIFLFVAAVLTASVMIFASDTRLVDLQVASGRYHEAIRSYHRLIAENPGKAAELYKGLAIVYARMDKKELAEQALLEAWRAGNREPEVLLQLYQLAAAREDRKSVILFLRQLREVEPESPVYPGLLAEAYVWNQQPELALSLYDSLIASDNFSPNMLLAAARLHRDLGNYRAAIDRVLRYQTVNGDYSQRRFLAELYLAAGEKKPAAALFEQILAERPGETALRSRLIDLYMWMDLPEKAVAHLDRMADGGSNSLAARERFFELLRTYQPMAAIRLLQRKLEREPRNNAIRHQLAALYLHIGESERAVTSLRDILRTAPGDTSVLREIARIRAERRRPDKFTEAMNALLAADIYDQKLIDKLIIQYRYEKETRRLQDLHTRLITSGNSTEKTLRDYAELLYQTGRYREAALQLQELLNRFPGDAELRLQLAAAYEAAGEDDRAADALWQGIQSGQRDEGYLVAAADFLARKGHYDRSSAGYTMLVKMNPSNTRYRKRLISVNIARAAYAEALRAYDDLEARRPLTFNENLERASLYWLSGDEQSMHAILSGLEKNDLTAVQRDALTRFYFQRGFLKKAISRARNALLHEPADSLNMRILGIALAWSNQPQQATEILEQYQQRYGGDYQTHFQLGELYTLAGKKERAAEEYAASLDLLSRRIAGRQERIIEAHIRARQGQVEDASRIFEELLAQAPEDASLLAEYTSMLLESGSYQQAGQVATRLLAVDPENSRGLHLQSRIFARQGRLQQAADLLWQLWQKYPENTGYLLDFADIAMLRGDWRGARDALREIITRDPANQPARERLDQLRRNNPLALASLFEASQQTSRFSRWMYGVLYSAARSPVLNFIFSGEDETNVTDYAGLGTHRIRSANITLRSRWTGRWQSEVTAQGRTDAGRSEASLRGSLTWMPRQGIRASAGASWNQLWREAYPAVFYFGRADRVQSDVYWYLRNGLYFWNRLTFERYRVLNEQHLGQGLHAFARAGYEWRRLRGLSTFYQFSRHEYATDHSETPLLAGYLLDENIHSLGLNFSRRLGPRFYLNLSGSLGYRPQYRDLLQYGELSLDYTFMRNLLLRSRFVYGNSGYQYSDNQAGSISFYLGYFY